MQNYGQHWCCSDGQFTITNFITIWIYSPINRVPIVRCRAGTEQDGLILHLKTYLRVSVSKDFNVCVNVHFTLVQYSILIFLCDLIMWFVFYKLHLSIKLWTKLGHLHYSNSGECNQHTHTYLTLYSLPRKHRTTNWRKSVLNHKCFYYIINVNNSINYINL